MVRLVELHRDAALPVPSHYLLVITDGFFQREGSASVHQVEPEQWYGAPGDVNRIHVHLCQADKVVCTGIRAHQGVVASSRSLVKLAIILRASHRHAASSSGAWVLPFGMEEVRLGILVDPERDHIERFGFRDLADAFDAGLHGR